MAALRLSLGQFNVMHMYIIVCVNSVSAEKLLGLVHLVQVDCLVPLGSGVQAIKSQLVTSLFELKGLPMLASL